ncbi:hypothetical protein OAO01_07570 [Oligoflexia bacterium]|nr:hypothetical protein [Oligoflexia bacterium]
MAGNHGGGFGFLGVLFILGLVFSEGTPSKPAIDESGKPSIVQANKDLYIGGVTMWVGTAESSYDDTDFPVILKGAIDNNSPRDYASITLGWEIQTGDASDSGTYSVGGLDKGKRVDVDWEEVTSIDGKAGGTFQYRIFLESAEVAG